MFGKLRGFILIGAISCLASSARASILLEPYVGYELGQFAMTAADVNDYKYNMGGVAVGGRLGYSATLVSFGLWGALDYSMANYSTSVASQPAGGTATGDPATRSSLFIDVGVKLPLLQAHVGYAPMNSMVMKATGGDLKYEGSAMKLGVGFSGLPFIAINLDYIASTFNKYTSAAGTTTDISSGQTISKATATTYMLNVSLPFNL